MSPVGADLSVMAAAGTSRVVDVDGVPMSALVAEARQPQAVIVALHGGATNSAYFDCPNRPRLSLLRAGAALGFTVIALDRPGYGSSAAHADATNADPARRVDLAYAAVDRLLTSRQRGVGVFLMAHSIGCELAVRMASDERGSGLLGVELAGTGRHHHAAAAETLAAVRHDRSLPMRTRLRDLIWHQDRLYPPDVVGGASIASATPAYERTAVERWASVDFPALAARVRVPVHFSLGDHEPVWRSGASALAEVAAMFTASPRVVVNEQADSGHNLSLGHSAMAYHLTVLSFVEECLLGRENGIAR
jgi:pimeloyl-ACP methyl ester carboxylesterase